MTLLLAGDIGGTKTILRLVEAESDQPQSGMPMKTLHEAFYASHDFPDLVPMVKKFLEAAAQQLGYNPQPQKACFAIAGPVVNNTSNLTNLAWVLQADRLEQQLGLKNVALINDFVAVGYGVLGLGPDDLRTLQPGQREPGAPIAVIGAGTGLGQGFLVRQSSDRYQVYGSEGGHVDFAPRSELEFQLLKYLLDKHDIQRVSVERVVSGQGIVSIYEFLRDRQLSADAASTAAETEVGRIVRAWEQQAGQSEKTVDPAAAISMAALNKSDRLAEQTMQIFVDAYGTEAGNLALKLLPYGGLFIAGGIAAKNLPLMEDGRFLKAFAQKGRISPLLDRVPVHIVLNPRVGLVGAAVCAAGL